MKSVIFALVTVMSATSVQAGGCTSLLSNIKSVTQALNDIANEADQLNQRIIVTSQRCKLVDWKTDECVKLIMNKEELLRRTEQFNVRIETQLNRLTVLSVTSFEKGCQ